MIPGTTTIRFLLVATASISAASSIARAGCKTESKTAIVMSNDINFFTCVLSFLCLCLGFPSYFFLISLITSTIMQIIYPKTIMPTGTTTKIRKNLPIYSYMAASTMLPIFIPSCPFQSSHEQNSKRVVIAMVPGHGWSRKSLIWYRKRSPFLVKLTWEKTNQKGAGRYLPTGNHSGCDAVHIPKRRHVLWQTFQ